MKQILLLGITFLALSISNTVFSADDKQDTDDSSNMTIENIIASCESQYTAEMYPDTEERNKLIDQCVSDNAPVSKE